MDSEKLIKNQVVRKDFSFKVADTTTETNSWANDFTKILPLGLNNQQNGETMMTCCKSEGVNNHILFVLFRIQNERRAEY